MDNRVTGRNLIFTIGIWLWAGIILNSCCSHQDEPGSPPKAYPEPVFNVLEFGAVPETDCTAAIQAVMDLAKESGGTVLIPAGTYRINALQSLRPQSNETIYMEKNAILEAIANGAQGYAIIALNEVTNVTLEGGTLLGERSAHTGTLGEWGMGLSVRDANGIQIKNMASRECWGDGFYVAGGDGIAFENVVADHNRRQGMSIVKGENITITNSIFCNTQGTLPEAGIDIEPDGGNSVRNVRISNCLCQNNAGDGIQTGVPMVETGRSHVVGVILESNTCSNNGKTSLYGEPQHGIHISNMEQVEVRSCNSQDNGGNGLLVRSHSTNTTIINNLITNNGWNGIQLYQVSHGIITGNTITNNGRYGILSDEVSDYTIVSNLISGNGEG